MGEFEVFDSGGGWSFLFGKPLLVAFRAQHDYEDDLVHVSGANGQTTLHNQLHAAPFSALTSPRDVNVILDWKQWGDVPGGENPPSRRVPDSCAPGVKRYSTDPLTSVVFDEPPELCEESDEDSDLEEDTGAWIEEVVDEADGGIAEGKRQEQAETAERMEEVEATRPATMAQRTKHTPPRPSVEEVEDEEHVRLRRRRAYARGSDNTLPSREVPPHMSFLDESSGIDTFPAADDLDPGVEVWGVDSADPASSVYTRLTDPHGPERVRELLRRIKIGPDLTQAERTQVVALLTEFADCFALSVGEVKPADEAVHRLNIPEGATFSVKPRQRPLTPPQRQYLNGKVDEMLAAGIIEPVHPSRVKAVSPTTLAQKAHEGGGLTLDELQYRINEECTGAGLPPMFELPPHPAAAIPHTKNEPPLKWRVCQNFNEVNKVTTVAPMPQGDI
ncbi:hypothetical protein EWM64_g1338 [Hericium alpestre]|uniref:Reverse transcriptase domain-containing protein n=1 Tax=Hericium alpestre TaxID=135208 RepID=A0A4Z0A6I7_9AGAM|nr:hypothetical protein EWM64_g1338 [Hericium alpestre]